jgi:hypothetical protein
MDRVFGIEETIKRMREISSDMTTSLITNMEASDNLVGWFEKKMGVKLPDDFKLFYYFSDGMEGGEDMFRIIPLDEIVDNNEDRHRRQGAGEFWFAEYLIYCDAWTVSIDKNDHNKYVIYHTGPGDRVDLTNSLAEFLERYLDGGVYDGIYEWREEVKRSEPNTRQRY